MIVSSKHKYEYQYIALASRGILIQRTLHEVFALSSLDEMLMNESNGSERYGGLKLSTHGRKDCEDRGEQFLPKSKFWINERLPNFQ